MALITVAPPHLLVLPGGNLLRRGEADRLLIPDVLILERDADSVRTGALAAAPEDVYLAAEVISPSSRMVDLHTKRALYAEWGVGSYWVLDPQVQELHEFGLRPSESCWLADVDLATVRPDPPSRA